MKSSEREDVVSLSDVIECVETCGVCSFSLTTTYHSTWGPTLLDILDVTTDVIKIVP
jgi:hypothetical protein